jgi:hypothetical protein
LGLLFQSCARTTLAKEKPSSKTSIVVLKTDELMISLLATVRQTETIPLRLT